MNNENDHAYFRCRLEGESPRAIKVRLDRDGTTHWVPKSLCEFRKKESSIDGVLEVEQWFADKEMD